MQISKSQLMQSIAQGLGHECFEHSNEGVFDITLMRAWAATHLTAVTVELAHFIEFVREGRIWEAARVDELTYNQWRYDPIMFVAYPTEDGPMSHVLVDGTHRALRAHKEGSKFIKAFIVPEDKIIRPAADGIMLQDAWGAPLRTITDKGL
jgi:hypothetical protein